MSKTITTKKQSSDSWDSKFGKRNEEIENKMNDLLEEMFELQFEVKMDSVFGDYTRNGDKTFKEMKEDFIKEKGILFQTRFKEIKKSFCNEFYVRFHDEIFFECQSSRFILDSDILKKKNNKGMDFEWNSGFNYKKELKTNRDEYYKNFSQSQIRNIYSQVTKDRKGSL